MEVQQEGTVSIVDTTSIFGVPGNRLSLVSTPSVYMKAVVGRRRASLLQHIITSYEIYSCIYLLDLFSISLFILTFMWLITE